MTIKVVDCRGLSCPHPVINTKKALMESDDTVVTIVDNDISRQNVSLFAHNNGYLVAEEKKDGAYHLTIRRQGGSQASPESQAGHQDPGTREETTPGLVYFITTNTLGQGSPDLGQVLMKSLFVTLAATTPRPAALLFLNSGVFLTCRESPVLEQLEQLHQNGTTILACGTCLDYYKLGDQLVWGTVSNMMDINNWLCKPHRVITIA